MLLATLGNSLLSKAAGAAASPVIDYFKSIITNENAFSFAKERLRPTYEPQFLPSSYDHVIEPCRLNREDFVSYFALGPSHDPEAVYRHLVVRLRERSESWVFHRPSDERLDAFFRDFIAAYEKYFYVHDQHLSVLNVAEMSHRILEIVESLRASLVAPDRPDVTSRRARTLAEDVLEFLTTVGLPLEIREAGRRQLDVLIADPSSIFPSRIYLGVRDSVDGEEVVDELAQRARGEGRLSNILLITAARLPYEMIAYSERRGIVASTVDEARDMFIKIAPSERYVMGTIAARTLAQTHNVGDVYVVPEAIPAELGERIEPKMLTASRSVLELIEDFLADPAQSILFIFGGYGSGKSALCAHLLHSFLPSLGTVSAVYIALRQITSGDALERLVTKAHQLATGSNERKPTNVVLLDGLDEIQNAMHMAERRKNILALLRCTARTDKMIVTVRTSYFRGIEEFWDLFARADDNPLWAKMARFIPETGHRPSASAVVIRDFNTDQIYQYACEFQQKHGLEDRFAERFLESVKENDVSHYYNRFLRSPLYLFLIMQSRPWETEGVASLGDIIEVMIRYWLARDIEKGQSRWLLSTEDRWDFMQALSQEMFNNERIFVTFDTFAKAVVRFFGTNLKDPRADSIALDLQTTGLLMAVDDKLYFLMPAFFDYFVAKWFLENERWRHEVPEPRHLPSADQAKLWASLAETRRIGLSHAGQRVAGKLLSPDHSRGKDRMRLPAKGLLYGAAANAGDPWTFLNRSEQAGMREIINAALAPRPQIADEVRLIMTGPRGLHARPCARLIHAYEQWADAQPSRPTVHVRKDGDSGEVSVESIMGLMMLGAGEGSILVFRLENCTAEQFAVLLRSLGCKSSDEASDVWEGEILRVDSKPRRAWQPNGATR